MTDESPELEKTTAQAQMEGVFERMREWHAKNRGCTPRQSAHQIIRFAIGDHGIADLMAGVGWETDRGLVVVASQVIDDALREALSDFFRYRSGISDDDLKFWFKRQPMPPFQSTGLKIRLASALGLIDKSIAKALGKLQSIRSQSAAHSRDSFELTLEHTREILAPLEPHLVGLAVEDRELLFPKRPHDGGRANAAATSFYTAAAMLYSLLKGAADTPTSAYISECDKCHLKEAFTGHGGTKREDFEARIQKRGWYNAGGDSWLCVDCKPEK